MNDLKINKENFKTLLLAFLVLISIYFVKNFWDTTLHNNADNYSEETVEDDEKSYKLYDVIIPQKTLVNFNEDERTVIYSNSKYDIWNKGKLALDDIFDDKDVEKNLIDIEKYNELSNDRSIKFHFSQELYTHMVGKILGIEIPKEVYQNIKTISNIKFSIGERSFLELSNENEKVVLKVERSKLDQLEELLTQVESGNYTTFYKLEQVTGVKSDVYIPVRSQNSIPTVNINKKYNLNRDININDTIAELFFYKKIEYIKKIEESNGSSIYIDGENILKIYRDGKLEYIGGIEEDAESDLYSSLKKAVDFISSHRGWPDNVYLSDIEDIAEKENIKGYRFIFRYKTNGLTVYSDKNNIQDKIEIEVIQGSITSYKSRIWNNLGTVSRKSEDNTISAFEIYDNNFLFLKKQYMKHTKDQTMDMTDEEINDQVRKSINDIYLAYYGDLNGEQETLKPVWAIEILGDRYLFDAYSGELKS